MIYLIGGPPKGGKTTLAKKLSKSKGIPWISTDTLQCVALPFIKEENLTDVFPSRAQKSASNDEKYSKYSRDEIINAYRGQAKSFFQSIEYVIDCEALDGHDYIIEGYHIEPVLAKKIMEKYPNQVKSIFLVQTNMEQCLQNIAQSTNTNDWIITKTKEPETYKKITHMLATYGQTIFQEAEQNGLEVFDMSSNFESQLQKAQQFID